MWLRSQKESVQWQETCEQGQRSGGTDTAAAGVEGTRLGLGRDERGGGILVGPPGGAPAGSAEDWTGGGGEGQRSRPRPPGS